MSNKQTRREFLKRTGAAGLSVATFGILSRRAHAAASGQPNILFFFPDQHRPDWSTLNRDVAVRTPNFARLAERGVRFTQTVTPSPLCAPARACLALGREYDRTGVPTNKDNLADGAVTFYGRLREAGYRVGGVGKFDLRKGAFDWGLDGQHRVNGHNYFDEWGFTDGLDSEGKAASLRNISNKDDLSKARGEAPYSRYLSNRNDGSLQRYIEWNSWKKHPIGYVHTEPMEIADEAYNDNWVGRNGLELIRRFPSDAPWFLQVNFPGPHPPMDITPSMAAWYEKSDYPQPHRNDQLPQDTHTSIRRNYSAMVDNIDQWLGRYLDAIEQRGELDNTIVVWSSDHGEMLGDHNRWGKSVPYQPSVSVPLIVAGPGIRKGATHEGPTTTLDLPATFLDYAGAAALPDADSRTLRPVLESAEAPGRSHVVSGLGPWRMVQDKRYKLIQGFDPAKQKGEDYAGTASGGPAAPVLFDLQADPFEDVDLATKATTEVERLSGLLPAVRTT